MIYLDGLVSEDSVFPKRGKKKNTYKYRREVVFLVPFPEATTSIALLIKDVSYLISQATLGKEIDKETQERKE